MAAMFKLWHQPLLFLTGVVAGFVDSIAGGGGLITLPVLLSLGLDPQHALGTNKLQATFGLGSATWHFARARTVPLQDCVRGFALTLAGAALGALAVQQLDPSFLKRAIPVLLISVAIYTLLRPRLGAEDLHPRMVRGAFDLTFGLLLGFYDGFFGPGAGTFWTMAFMLGAGLQHDAGDGLRQGDELRQQRELAGVLPCGRKRLLRRRAGYGGRPGPRCENRRADGHRPGNEIHPSGFYYYGARPHAKAALRRLQKVIWCFSFAPGRAGR